MTRVPAVPVSLPTLHWGEVHAPRRALLLHGLTSASGTWWRVASDLADRGWSVTAPDLRGHGAAPRSTRYGLADYAADVAELRVARAPGAVAAEVAEAPRRWDLVIGHSLGGAVAVTVAAAEPMWAEALLLLDPVLALPVGAVDAVLADLLGDLEGLDPVALHRAHPLWHLEDAVQKVNAARVVSPFVVERTIRGNADSDSPWRLESLVAQLRGRVRVHVLAADPALGASFSVEEGERLRSGGDGFGYAVLEGVSHSVHRDYPQRVVVEAMALAAGNASAGSPPNP